MPNRAKTERLEARVTPRQKRLLTEAAELFGVNEDDADQIMLVFDL